MRRCGPTPQRNSFTHLLIYPSVHLLLLALFAFLVLYFYCSIFSVSLFLRFSVSLSFAVSGPWSAVYHIFMHPCNHAFMHSCIYLVFGLCSLIFYRRPRSSVRGHIMHPCNHAFMHLFGLWSLHFDLLQPSAVCGPRSITSSFNRILKRQ